VPYALLRALAFRLEPERAHELTLRVLAAAQRLHLLSGHRGRAASGPVRLMGLEFANRVGLAAGFDKNAVCVDALAALGFGFIEVGTVTPRPQPGNPRPRLFREVRARAIVNRMGFPNEGAEAACRRLAAWRRTVICGINIGKNASTPLDAATDDYLTALRMVYASADYVAINISSPNTTGLRELEQPARLRPLLEALLAARSQLASRSGRRVPLLLKLSPDLSHDDLSATAATLAELRIDGAIATNSTVQRPTADCSAESGGLSGPPLLPLATRTVRRLRTLLGAGFPIIGVGGIDSYEAALEMRAAGADLLQIYTGLVYRGPRLVRNLSRL